MRFNVAGLLRAPTGETRIVDVDEPVVFDEDGVHLCAPVRGRLKLIRDHAGVLVQGELATRAVMACARCLTPTEVDVEFLLEEEFRPTVFIPGGPPLLPPSEREAVTEIDEHHVLDLTEVVRQNLAVALPWNALCRPDCAGLCPTCGADLNEGPCGCVPAADPRWAALSALLSQTEEPEGGS